MMQKLWCLLGVHNLDVNSTELLKKTRVYWTSSYDSFSHAEYVYVSNCINCGKKVKTKIKT